MKRILLIILMFIIFQVPSKAHEFDKIIHSAVNNGLFYAALIENDTALILISSTDEGFIITVYGSENEIIDTLTVRLNNKSNIELWVSPLDNDFTVSLTERKKSVHYRLINDSLTPSGIKPASSEKIAAVKNGKINITADIDNVHSLMNDLKKERLSHLHLPKANLDDSQRSQIITLLKCCCDIVSLDESTDDDALLRRVLYTHKNFMLLTPIPPKTAKSGSELTLCSANFIDAAMQSAFRKAPSRPAVNMLTELGYCYNNGYYYYTGGYTKYFATEISEIIQTYTLPDKNIYAVFSDKYTESGKEPVFEYSTAVISKDKNGFYLTRLKMGGEAYTETVPANHSTEKDNTKTVLLIIISCLILLVLLCVVIYIIIL